MGSSATGGKTVVTVRLWDEQVAAAYRQSFDGVHPRAPQHRGAHQPGLLLDVLRHPAHRRGRRQRRRHLLAVQRLPRRLRRQRAADDDRDTPIADWEPAVVDQFTRNGALWGVPQLTDAGIAVYYNADLLAAAGVIPPSWTACAGVPSGDDTLRPLLARLTVDANGHRRGHNRFRRRDGSASGATTPPTTCRASTSTTSARRAACSSTATSSRSTTPRRPKRSATWSA